MTNFLYSVILVVAFLHLGCANEYPLARGICGLNYSRGTLCTDTNATEPRIMFHFDKVSTLCLAFKYNGCGGNENRFETKFHCQMTCIPADYGSCALSKPSLKDNKGNSVICSTHKSQNCPTGYRCKRLAFYGICCEEKNEQLFDKNFFPKCAIGKPKTLYENGYRGLFIGKNCDDNFCPVDHKCQQLEVFAHCCPQ